MFNQVGIPNSPVKHIQLYHSHPIKDLSKSVEYAWTLGSITQAPPRRSVDDNATTNTHTYLFNSFDPEEMPRSIQQNTPPPETRSILNSIRRKWRIMISSSFDCSNRSSDVGEKVKEIGEARETPKYTKSRFSGDDRAAQDWDVEGV